jgi:hypothetical protein
MLNAFYYKNKMNTVGYVVQLHNILFSTFTQKKNTVFSTNNFIWCSGVYFTPEYATFESLQS